MLDAFLVTWLYTTVRHDSCMFIHIWTCILIFFFFLAQKRYPDFLYWFSSFLFRMESTVCRVFPVLNILWRPQKLHRCHIFKSWDAECIREWSLDRRTRSQGPCGHEWKIARFQGPGYQIRHSPWLAPVEEYWRQGLSCIYKRECWEAVSKFISSWQGVHSSRFELYLAEPPV